MELGKKTIELLTPSLNMNDGDIILKSSIIMDVFEKIEIAAKYDYNILLEGESGVGKDIFANYIYKHGKRASGKFIAVNCGAIPENLFEAEFFGYERGSFTNAINSHKGFFEQANGGVLLLDEISELPLYMQVKLLRAIEDKFIRRIGSENIIKTDTQIIAATNKNLSKCVNENKFRQDLYYRLAIINITIPPLRERIDDILPLANYFLVKHGCQNKSFSPEAEATLLEYKWPGNIRELETCMINVIIRSNGKTFIERHELQINSLNTKQNLKGLLEREGLERTLKSTNGSVKLTSTALGVHRNTIYNKLKKHNLTLSIYRIN